MIYIIMDKNITPNQNGITIVNWKTKHYLSNNARMIDHLDTGRRGRSTTQQATHFQYD